jgi:3-isopropylmalate dehydrogenase
MLRSVALLLEHALGEAELAARLETAIDDALATVPTPDAGGTASTPAFTDAVLERLALKEEPWRTPA